MCVCVRVNAYNRCISVGVAGAARGSVVLYNFLCGRHFCICVGGAYKAAAAAATAACCPFTIDYSQSVLAQLLLLFAPLLRQQE